MTGAAKRPDRPRVLIAGGGVAGLETMLALRAFAEERVEIELLAAEPHFWYRPLAVAEPFAAGRVEQFELAGIAKASGAGFVLGMLASVDPERRVATATNGLELAYDLLVLACGASPERAIEGALTFRGPADSNAFTRLLFELERDGGRLVIAIPDGHGWPLPGYELALQSARHFADDERPGVEVVLVTPERRPLALFGAEASQAIDDLLTANRIELHTGRRPVAAEQRVLRLDPAGELRFDQLVGLPRLRGQRISGIPADRHGFIHSDEHGRVPGLEGVYAAGDLTSFPIKQGGIAAQQADAVAAAIAALAGAPVTAEPFRPVLRGLLLTGGSPAYLRSEPARTGSGVSSVADEPLWWPPAKIVGRYLAPFLAEHAGNPASTPPQPPSGAVTVDVALPGSAGADAAQVPAPLA
jgi:sulfide:quinone oxidoreductase